MAVSAAFLDMICEMLAPLGTVSVRRMFGGASLYCNGLLFALVADDQLFLKADSANEARFRDEGLKPFTYDGKTGPVAMSYWQAPDRLFDENDEMLDFVKDALAAAARAGAAKKSKKSRSPQPPAKTASRPRPAKGAKTKRPR